MKQISKVRNGVESLRGVCDAEKLGIQGKYRRNECL
jgi:hypothetical protein